jgi:hypothetical protein
MASAWHQQKCFEEANRKNKYAKSARFFGKWPYCGGGRD